MENKIIPDVMAEVSKIIEELIDKHGDKNNGVVLDLVLISGTIHCIKHKLLSENLMKKVSAIAGEKEVQHKTELLTFSVEILQNLMDSLMEAGKYFDTKDRGMLQ